MTNIPRSPETLNADFSAFWSNFLESAHAAVAETKAHTVSLPPKPEESEGDKTANGLMPPPVIPAPSEQFSPEDLAAMLTHLQGKTKEAQLRTAHETLAIAGSRMETANKDALTKIQEANEKAQSAAAKAKTNDILGWITRSLGLAGALIGVGVAAVLTVVTGGAAAPLLLMAGLGLVTSIISMADGISQEAGGPSLTLSSLLTKLCSCVLEAMGVSKEDAEKYGKLASGAIGFAIPLALTVLTGGAAAPLLLPLLIDPSLAGNFVGGIAEVAGADENTVMILATVATVVTTVAIAIAMIAMSAGTGAAAAVPDTASKITTAALKFGPAIAQAVLGLVQGGMATATGSIAIAKAQDDRDVANLNAEKKKIDALLIKLQGQMEEQKEEIQKLIEELMDSYKIVMQMFSNAASNRQQLTANIGGRNATV
jgi:transloator